MYKYFEPKDNDSFLLRDPTYSNILEKTDGFMATLGEEEKTFFIKMISECYHKLHRSIQAKSDNNVELFNSLIMALLIEQSKEIERLTMGN